jgi:hypothetical protein
MESNPLPNSKRLLMSRMAALLDLIPGPRPSPEVPSCSVMEENGPIYQFEYFGADLLGPDSPACETNAADEDIFFLATWSYRKGDQIPGAAAVFDVSRWVCPAPQTSAGR